MEEGVVQRELVLSSTMQGGVQDNVMGPFVMSECVENQGTTEACKMIHYHDNNTETT